MSVCTNCGNTNMDGVKFCTTCGTPVAPAPVTETPVVETPVAPTPVVETPVAPTPVMETPVVETPVVETPNTVSQPNNAFQPQNNSFQPQNNAFQPQGNAFQQAYQKPQQGQPTAFEQAYMPKQPQQPNGFAGGVPGQQPFNANMGGGQKPMNKGVLIAIIAAGAAFLIIIIVVCVLLFGGKPYEKTIKKLEKALNSGKPEKLLDVFPEIPGVSSADMLDEFDELEDYEFDIKIIDATALDADDVEYYSHHNMFMYSYDDEIDLSQGYEVSVEISTKYKDSEPSKTFDEIIVGKVDGEWVIISLY